MRIDLSHRPEHVVSGLAAAIGLALLLLMIASFLLPLFFKLG